MNKKILLLPVLALVPLFSGCEGTGPNTQNGAVAGAALGAIAGAIIGHNSGSGNTLAGAAIGGAAGALAGGTIGNSVDHEEGTVYGQPRPTSATYTVVETPLPTPPAPAPQPPSAAMPPPAPNALWVQGYWSFDGTRYTWVNAHWEVPPPLATSYVPAHWEQQNGGYVFVPGYWQ